ncbi:MAG: hypothetical protein V8S96_06005 [Lachnospiraceae bacterium]
MGACALAGGFLIRSENRFLLGTLAVLTLLLYRVTGIGPALSGWIVWPTRSGGALASQPWGAQCGRNGPSGGAGGSGSFCGSGGAGFRRGGKHRTGSCSKESGYFPACGWDLRKAWTK